MAIAEPVDDAGADRHDVFYGAADLYADHILIGVDAKGIRTQIDLRLFAATGDAAGDDDRRDVHYLTVTPTFIKLLSRRHALLFDTEGIADWERDDELRWKSGVLYGTRISGRRALWVKLEMPWGEHRAGEWTLRTSIAWRGKKEAPAKRQP